LGAAVAAGAAWALLAQDRVSLAALETALGELGQGAPAAFVGSFAFATVLFVPGSVFGLAGGMLFGPLWGTLWNVVGGTLGATIAFLVARYVAGEWTAKTTGGRLKSIVEGAEAEGWRFVALTRLVPIVPFNLLNYALGLTRISLSQYVLATLVCMIPGAAAYSWLGHAGRAAMAGHGDAVRYARVGLGLLAIIAFVPRLVLRVRVASGGWTTVPELKQRWASGTPLTLIDVREPEEFAGPLGHLPGARNIPMAHLPAHLDEIKAQHTMQTVLVCKTDKRSSKAAAVLRAAGIQNVSVLRGGMEEWNGSESSGPDHRSSR
jgi:uncharacterized membrane protein YdjX (TVP38/TMEM64 family)/rhodanese-related sulfurtransferase